MITTHVIRQGARIAVLSLPLLATTASARVETTVPPALTQIGVDERVGDRIPLDTVFVNAQGERVTLGRYVDGDMPVLLVLAYNRCPMLCSLVLRGVADGLRELDWEPGRDYRVLTISIDPGQTTHEAAREQEVYLEQVGYSGQTERWPFLVGDEAAIRTVAASLGFRYAWDERTDQFAHPAVIFVLSPVGMISHYLHGVRFDSALLKAVLSESKSGSLGTFEVSDDSILSCFRFESVLRAYGPAIQRFFRAGALLIALIVLAALLVLFRREGKERYHE